MLIEQIVWDLDDDPDGNVQHIAEHELTVEEVEEVLYSAEAVFASQSSGRPIVFGQTSTGKYIAVAFDVRRACLPFIRSPPRKPNRDCHA